MLQIARLLKYAREQAKSIHSTNNPHKAYIYACGSVNALNHALCLAGLKTYYSDAFELDPDKIREDFRATYQTKLASTIRTLMK